MKKKTMRRKTAAPQTMRRMAPLVLYVEALEREKAAQTQADAAQKEILRLRGVIDDLEKDITRRFLGQVEQANGRHAALKAQVRDFFAKYDALRESGRG